MDAQSVTAASLPLTKDEAKRQGSKFFFTGRPCKRGHLSPRRADNGMCIECSRITAKRRAEAKRVECREYSRQMYNDNPLYRAKSRCRRAGMPYPSLPPHLEGLLEQVHQEAALRRLEGEDVTVDHIHPLSKGGLQMAHNCQVLTRSANSRKSDNLLPCHMILEPSRRTGCVGIVEFLPE